MGKFRLREARNDRGFTQAEIAKALGITRSAYSHYENDIREIPLDTLVQLANFYKCSTDELLGTNVYYYYIKMKEGKI